MRFINFHNHSEFSFLSSLLSVEDLVRHTAESGFPGCCVTDTLSTYSFYRLTKLCRSHGIRPVYGLEIFVRGVSGGRGHYPVLLIALNNAGLQNLFRINTLAHQVHHKTSSFTLPLDAVHPYREGLAVLLESELYFNRDRPAVLDQAVHAYRAAFGENLFVEANYCGQKKVPILKQVVEMIGRFGLNGLATCESRYLPADRDAFAYLNGYREKSHARTEKGLPIDTECVYALRASAEWPVIFKNHPDYVKNAETLFERIETDFDIKSFKIPRFFREPHEKLRSICERRLEKSGAGPDYRKRLEYELGIVQKLGLPDYFLLVYDMTRYMRQKKIPFGPGRGSAVSSLILHLLGVTRIDPVRFNLLFERFLNPGRRELPDVDLDVCWKKRKFVFSFIATKYGRRNVARLAAVDRLMARSVVREISKTFKLKRPKMERLLSILPAGRDLSLKTLLKSDEKFLELGSDPELRSFLEIVSAIEGTAAHSTVHSGGTLVIPSGVKRHASLEYSRNGEVVAQITADDLEDTGFVKFDILGLRFLSVLSDAMRLAGIESVPPEDPATYDFLSAGDTTAVFQLEGGGMKNLLRSVKPRSLLELSDVIALYRPGPIRAGMTEEYVRRHARHERSEQSLAEHNLKDHPYLVVTADSFGLFIYQEQILLLAHDYADMSWERSDLLRKALARRDNSLIVGLREEFLRGCRDNRIDDATANQLFGLLVDFGSYSFNKSHSLAYALNAYHGAWLKLHHPMEFMLASLNNNLDSSSRLNRMLMDVKFHSGPSSWGWKLLPIDINSSSAAFRREDGHIRCALSIVKYVGQTLAVEIVRERKRKGAFRDLVDFTVRMKPKGLTVKSVEFLIKAGAFDVFGNSRSEMLCVHTDIAKYASGLTRKGKNPAEDKSLFGDEDGGPTVEHFLKSCPEREREKDDKFLMEMEATDVQLTRHPLDDHLEFLKEHRYQKFEDIGELSSGAFAGYLFKWKPSKTRSGKPMATGHFSDRTGAAEAVFFPAALQRFGTIMKTGSLYVIGGTVRDGRLVVEQVFLFEEALRGA